MKCNRNWRAQQKLLYQGKDDDTKTLLPESNLAHDRHEDTSCSRCRIECCLVIQFVRRCQQYTCKPVMMIDISNAVSRPAWRWAQTFSHNVHQYLQAHFVLVSTSRGRSQ